MLGGSATNPLQVSERQLDDFGFFFLGNFNDLLLSLQHLGPPSAWHFEVVLKNPPNQPINSVRRNIASD